MICRAAWRMGWVWLMLTLLLGVSAAADSKKSSRDVINLFSDEIQQAVVKMKWRGERLTDDTLYAVALTGVSWEPAWGKDHLFSMAWGDWKKVSRRRKDRDAEEVIEEVRRLTEARQYQRAMDKATAMFSLEEMSCDITLKDAIGKCFFAMGQPERAFPIWASPFDADKMPEGAADANRRFREGAFEAATRAGLPRSAIAFALSLLLEPGTPDPTMNLNAMRYLEAQGVDIERVMLGILQAPERLRGLPHYYYAAADLLAPRATPRLLPFLMHLAQSDDDYLRSRALLGLGVAAYRKRMGEPANWSERVIWGANLREYGLSVGERKLVDREIKEAANDGNFRLRSAAALAAALMGEDEYLPLLQKLARDKAYILSPLNSRAKNARRTLLFPVRLAAAAALERYGVKVMPEGGALEGKAIEAAKRGNQDVSNDRRGLRREVAGQVWISPLDPVMPLSVSNQ